MNIDLSTLKANAQGRWHHIHATLGIPAELLNPHKHQPCPHCGGKDRFRYTPTIKAMADLSVINAPHKAAAA